MDPIGLYTGIPGPGLFFFATETPRTKIIKSQPNQKTSPSKCGLSFRPPAPLVNWHRWRSVCGVVWKKTGPAVSSFFSVARMVFIASARRFHKSDGKTAEKKDNESFKKKLILKKAGFELV